MNILALLNACKPIGVGIAGLAVIGGSAATIMNTTHTSETIPEVVVTEEVQVPILELKEETTETKEEKPAPEVASANSSAQSDRITKPAAPAPKTEQKKETNQPVKYSILGHKPLYSRDGWTNLFDDDGVQYTSEGAFTNINDFEKAAVGLCPNQIPAGAWPQKAKPGVALGIIGSPQYSKSPTAWADHLWSTMKNDPSAYIGNVVWLFASDLFDSLIGSDGVDRWEDKLGFTIDWNTLTIDWRRMYEDSNYKGKEGIGANTDAYTKMEAVATKMTARIRQRNAEFKTKCGY